MSKQPKDLRELLSMYKFDMDVLQKIPCTKQENKDYMDLKYLVYLYLLYILLRESHGQRSLAGHSL